MELTEPLFSHEIFLANLSMSVVFGKQCVGCSPEMEAQAWKEEHRLSS